MVNISELKLPVIIACALLLAGLQASCVNAAPASPTGTDKQGIHQWAALGGKLVAVAGTYQDTTTYKRSLTFYFEDKKNNEWNHVPIIESKVDHTLTWFSISNGETTVADAQVLQREDGIYLLTAEAATARNGITVSSYKFAEARDDFPDGPTRLFKKINSKICPKSACPTVEDALKREAASKPTK